MPGRPINDPCPSCGSDGGTLHDWFPELGDREEWPCGTVRGIDRYSGQRTAHTTKTCQTIRDLKAKVLDLESKLRANQGGAAA